MYLDTLFLDLYLDVMFIALVWNSVLCLLREFCCEHSDLVEFPFTFLLLKPSVRKRSHTHYTWRFPQQVAIL